jgi:ABC-type multidrug transport system fused ATPase/permease subunit
VTVSGGERQRLCLARAILKNPSVLILDEATSALDSNAEQLIQQSLATILADKTAIIIAHRLSTVQHVDRIVALDGGRIIDQGTHEELTGRCELYRELARKQLLL